MTKAAPPAGNPANARDLAGALAFALTKYGQRTDDMLPARVLSYDRATRTAKVIPAIPAVTTANEVVQKGIVASVPVFHYGCGGWVISFPLEVGDLGWIKANDRDISKFKATQSSASGPPTQRTHTFEDAMFFPDAVFREISLADEAGLCIQSLDGSVSIVLVGDKIKITAEEIELTGSTKITMSSPEIDLGSGNISAGGIRFDTHHHTGVQTGGGQTGGPVNP